MSEFSVHGSHSVHSFETTADYSDSDMALILTTSFMLEDSRQYLRAVLSQVEMKMLQDMLATSLKNFEEYDEQLR